MGEPLQPPSASYLLRGRPSGLVGPGPSQQRHDLLHLAVGNVVGSNIFNIGVVLGLTALISLEGIPVSGAAVAFDIPVMLAAAVALLPIAFTGFAVARWEGGLFVVLYAAYTGYLVLAATAHDALEGFTVAMAWFVLPLIALTLISFTAYEIGLRKGRRDLDQTTTST